MNTVQINGITRELPASWNELTGKQLVHVAKLIREGITVVDFKVKILFSFLKIKFRLFKKMNPEDVYFLGETLEFLIKDVNLTKNLIPRIKRYYGPDDSLRNITFGEFIRVQMAIESFNKDKNEDSLNNMLAVIYRPRKFAWWIRKYLHVSTDCRLKLLDRTCPKRTRAMGKVDYSVKYAVLLFVTGVFNSLPGKFPNVYKTKAKNEEKKSGWIDVIISLADGKTDDESLERIYNSNMYNVFYGLEKNATEYLKFKMDHPDLFKNE